MASAKWPAPPSGEVVPVHARHHDVVEPEPRDGLGQVARLVGIERRRTRAVFTLQNRQPRVQTSPISITVAVPPPQHSATFGQCASWQTVWSGARGACRGPAGTAPRRGRSPAASPASGRSSARRRPQARPRRRGGRSGGSVPRTGRRTRTGSDMDRRCGDVAAEAGRVKTRRSSVARRRYRTHRGVPPHAILQRDSPSVGLGSLPSDRNTRAAMSETAPDATRDPDRRRRRRRSGTSSRCSSARRATLCTTVTTAEGALEEARATDYPLVISDVRMPGHDGFWLLERLRESCPDTAVIMLTAFGDTEAAVECLRNGAADYLLKPPKVTELIRAIERALGPPPAGAGARAVPQEPREPGEGEDGGALPRPARPRVDLLADALDAGRRARRARARDERPLAAGGPLHARDRPPPRPARERISRTSAAARSCTTSARSACPTPSC